ncbi:hypothetical protein CPB85DRAFT_1259506 [Mucidula mucida]|nr:hypothetical protein CPB85DRAFT_1259506 [Mucidula mucida]
MPHCTVFLSSPFLWLLASAATRKLQCHDLLGSTLTDLPSLSVCAGANTMVQVSEVMLVLPRRGLREPGMRSDGMNDFWLSQPRKAIAPAEEAWEMIVQRRRQPLLFGFSVVGERAMIQIRDISLQDQQKLAEVTSIAVDELRGDRHRR